MFSQEFQLEQAKRKAEVVAKFFDNIIERSKTSSRMRELVDCIDFNLGTPCDIFNRLNAPDHPVRNALLMGDLIDD